MQKRENGFTLIELMITVAIVGILAAISYPSYQESVYRSRRAEAKSMLVEATARQERFFSQNNQYSANTNGLGYPAVSGNNNLANSENSYYQITVATATVTCPIATCFSMTATAVNGQLNDTKCRTLTLNSLGQKTATNSAAAAVTTGCW